MDVQESNGEVLQINKSHKRIASFDFFRGLSIWFMTLMHTFEHLYDYTWVKENPEKILELPIPLLIIGLVLGFFLSWNSFFLLISAIVNSLTMTRRAREEAEPKRILAKQTMSGVGILLAGVFADNLGYWGYFGQALLTGNWRDTYPLWARFFAMHTLQIIGWSMIITGIVQYFLLRKNGFEKFIRNIIICSVIIVAILVSSTFIQNWVDRLPWEIPINPPVGLSDNTKWPSIYFQAQNASLLAWFMTIMAGDMIPLFPYLATAFLGIMIGMVLARPKPVKRLPLIGGLSSLGLMGLGGILAAFGFYNLSNARATIGNYLLITGGQLAFTFLFLWLIEYRGNGKKFAQSKIVKHFRLWGMASLTIYCLQIFEILPRFLLTRILRPFRSDLNLLNSSVFGYGQEHYALLVGLFSIMFFELLIFLWSKLNFKFGFEWFVIRFSSIGSRYVSSRLNVDLIMNKVYWVNYKEILLESELQTKSLPLDAL